MEKFQEEIVKKMKQRVRTPQFLNRVINVYDFTTLFSRLMMYRRAKSSLVQPKKEGEEETTYNMYNSMFIRIKEKNKLNDRKMKRILKRFYNISPTATIDVMHTCMEYLSFLEGSIAWFALKSHHVYHWCLLGLKSDWRQRCRALSRIAVALRRWIHCLCRSWQRWRACCCCSAGRKVLPGSRRYYCRNPW